MCGEAFEHVRQDSADRNYHDDDDVDDDNGDNGDSDDNDDNNDNDYNKTKHKEIWSTRKCEEASKCVRQDSADRNYHDEGEGDADVDVDDDKA